MACAFARMRGLIVRLFERSWHITNKRAPEVDSGELQNAIKRKMKAQNAMKRYNTSKTSSNLLSRSKSHPYFLAVPLVQSGVHAHTCAHSRGSNLPF